MANKHLSVFDGRVAVSNAPESSSGPPFGGGPDPEPKSSDSDKERQKKGRPQLAAAVVIAIVLVALAILFWPTKAGAQEIPQVQTAPAVQIPTPPAPYASWCEVPVQETTPRNERKRAERLCNFELKQLEMAQKVLERRMREEERASKNVRRDVLYADADGTNIRATGKGAQHVENMADIEADRDAKIAKANRPPNPCGGVWGWLTCPAPIYGGYGYGGAVYGSVGYSHYPAGTCGPQGEGCVRPYQPPWNWR